MRSTRWVGLGGCGLVGLLIATTGAAPPAAEGGTEIVVSDLLPASYPWVAPLVAHSLPAGLKGKPRQHAVLVCPPALLSTMAPWIEHRQRQGYRIVQLDGRLDAPVLLRSIRDYASRQRVDYVLLVGDADLRMHHDHILRRRCVPTFLVAADINVRVGSESHIATDNPYGDLDGDQIPDVPVGRLTASSAEELAVIVEKILQYERLPAHGDWRRTIQLVAGVGDFGVLADTVIETATKKLLADGIPAAYRTGMTYGNWRSPYCPDPRFFREQLLGRVTEGCLFWVYMGHGRPDRLDRFFIGEAPVPILESDDVARFQAARGLPIAVLLACYTGAFDQPEECLAEAMLRTPGGPVAVFAASRVTLPYSMALLGISLLEALDQEHATLGDIILQGKRGLADEPSGATNRKLLHSLARTLSPTKEDLPGERREHQLLFNLLGDPLLRIARPLPMEVHCPDAITAGDKLIVRGESPLGGRCHIELACRCDRLTFTAPSRRRGPDSEEKLVSMTQIYTRANDPRWHHREVVIAPGRFAIELRVPEPARGPCVVRMMVASDRAYALAGKQVYVKPSASVTRLRVSNANR